MRTKRESERAAEATVFAVQPGLSPEHVLSLLAPVGTIVASRPRTITRVYLDTFDWRIWRTGARLCLESSPGHPQLRWVPPGVSPVVVAVAGPPRFAADLPEGTIRRSLAEVVQVRALLDMGEVAVRQRLIRVLDGERKTVARVVWEERGYRERTSSRSGTDVTLHLDHLTGYEAAARRVRERLLSSPHLQAEDGDELTEAAATRGRHPGDYTSRLELELDPRGEAGEATRTVLHHLLATVRANLDGVVRDLDIEFLHDLRVAVRRTRSALSQLEGVLDPAATAPFVDEFRWLGNATGPCRDLDVFLLQLGEAGPGMVPSVGQELVPLEERLRAERAAAHHALCGVLASARLARLLRRWRSFLSRSRPAPGAPDETRPVRDVAAERIQRAYARLLRHARRLGPRPPAEGMHRLRIDAKKLRYISELFASVVEPEAVRILIRQLKAIQDTLGSYHDLHVQQLHLLDIGRIMVADSGVSAETLLAMGRLAAHLELSQERHHDDFARRFAEFSGGAVRTAVAGLGHQGGGTA